MLKKRKFYLPALAALCLLVFFAGNTTESGYKVGDKAMDFNLKNVNGEMVSMASYEDAKGFILVFTCNTCPFSKMYEDRILELDKEYSAKGYPVIAVNSNDIKTKPGDSYEEMVKLAQEKSYSFPYLHDESQEVAKTYGATNTPHVYVLNKTKEGLKVAYIGAIDNNAKDASAADKKYVEEAVGALLDGKSVPTEHTKAIGCTIKWKST